MTQRKALKLWGSKLSCYIDQVARRHFRDKDDQADARIEAWEQIERSRCNLSLAQYQKIAYRVINAKYKRVRRQRLREVRTI